MNKWIKRSINLALFIYAFNTLEHVCHKATSGFALNRIQFNDQPVTHKTVDPFTFTLLNQPFDYLACGNQSYVFASRDGKYVLKFFKYINHNTPSWTSKVPLLNRFRSFRASRQERIAWKIKRDFESYQIAFEKFHDETALLHLHLQPTENTYPTITIQDKLGIFHQLDLNKTPFIFQKRATGVYTQFSTWIQKGEIDKVRNGISGLLLLCRKRIALNIEDDDVLFYLNFGFIDETPIQIDPGHWTYSDKPTSSTELQTLAHELKEWFSKNYPPLVTYVETCANTR